MNAPKITVVIATFNRASMLKEALQSLLAQTFSDFEAIIVDDGSTDDTEEVVKSFADSRFCYIYQENKGRSAARNRAITLVRGEFIAFLDSDDLFTPDKLYRQLTLLENNPDYFMSYTSANVIDDVCRAVKDSCYNAVESGELHDKIAFFLPITVLLPTVMLRSSILSYSGLFDERMERFEDIDLWRRISKHSKILAIDEPLTFIRTHLGNKMEHPQRIYESIKYYTQKIKDDPGVDVSLWRNGSARLFLHYGFAVYAIPNIKSLSYPFFFDAIKLSPDETIDSLDENQVFGVLQALRVFLNCLIYFPLKMLKFFLMTCKSRFIFRLLRFKKLLAILLFFFGNMPNCLLR